MQREMMGEVLYANDMVKHLKKGEYKMVWILHACDNSNQHKKDWVCAPTGIWKAMNPSSQWKDITWKSLTNSHF